MAARKMLQTKALEGYALLVLHIVNELQEGVPIGCDGVGTHVAFMWKVVGQETAQMFGKISRCSHRAGTLSDTQTR